MAEITRAPRLHAEQACTSCHLTSRIRMVFCDGLLGIDFAFCRQCADALMGEALRHALEGAGH